MNQDTNRERPESGHAARVVAQALDRGWIREEDTSVLFHDLGFMEARIGRLTRCFPETALHGLAIKANPLRKVMERNRIADDRIGVEAASAGEVFLALRAGYPPSRILFDSPVKTMQELRMAISLGVHLNMDNLTELERVASILSKPGTVTTSTFGLRINPQVGTGTIAGSSVAGVYSKFGVPLLSDRQKLEAACTVYPWLTGVHLHVGSQGCPPELLVNGIGRLYDFVLNINEKRKTKGLPPVSLFDIGGGLPVSYRDAILPPPMEDYAQAIRHRAPDLFDPGKFRILTEFGRWVFVPSGWTISRVEYVKYDAEVRTAMLHTGADLFLRECLNPQDWQHEYCVLDPTGMARTGTDPLPCNLAGPLCFSGDILARGLMLPAVEPGDWILIKDTGGYTYSMWSRYNSRLTPRIVGWSDGEFVLLRERETAEDLARFWE